ncbi:MAG: Vitamin B12 dependent methionine synthase activation subunit [Spirochaetes bacterium]|nr:Vitamin B12 dependent methionine synthase activation subunit [Spirochaetota bacterium]
MEIPEGEFFQSKIFQKEVLRYLGYRGNEADESVISQIALVSKEAAADINAKNIFGIWDCQAGTDTVTLGEINIKSRDLACHLHGCSHAVLLAATLGTGADTLLRRYSALDMEKALIAQAVCTAMIERYCDTVVCETERSPRLDGLYPTSRFSPGYGDFDISWQKDMLRLLNAEKCIALSLSDGYMLIPSKSVTAVVGFSGEKTDSGEKCKRCANTHCEYRKVM